MADTKTRADRDDLTAGEAADLAAALAERWGVSAGAAVSLRQVEGAAETEARGDIVLVSGGKNKIAVIRELRDLTRYGLGEAKALFEAAPRIVLENVPSDEARRAAARLIAVGAQVELRGFPGDAEATEEEDESLEVAALAIRAYADRTLTPPKDHIANIRSGLARAVAALRV